MPTDTPPPELPEPDRPLPSSGREGAPAVSPKGNHFDSERLQDAAPAKSAQAKRKQRPFIGIQFRCCKTYGRIYRNHDRTAYVGHCPKCVSRVSVPIRPDGGSARFFSAG